MPEQQPPPEGTVTPVTAPYLYGSHLGIQVTPHEMLITVGRVRPQIDSAGLIADNPVAEIIGIVVLSPQGAKDLAYMLGEAVKSFEETYGPVRTPTTDRAAGMVKAPKAEKHA
jgi:hypothetical protein